MDGLPQLGEFLKMVRRNLQYLPHVRPLGVRWPDRVVAVRQPNRPIRPQIDDDLHFTREPVNMTRWMIVRIDNESNTAKLSETTRPL